MVTFLFVVVCLFLYIVILHTYTYTLSHAKIRSSKGPRLQYTYTLERIGGGRNGGG